MISAIVAVDNNWGIGFNGDLLEHIPEDLKYFKALTTDHVVVMGRKTWDSLPVKPLKDRINIVISNSMFPFQGTYEWDVIKHLSLCMSMNYAKDYIRSSDDEIFIIGGGTIYKELLPFCDRIYVTKIFKDHDNVDTYFPNLDALADWTPAACGPIQEYKDLTYQFWQYDRI